MPNRRKKNQNPKEFRKENLIGGGRCFGVYRCEQCNRRWMSAYSMAGSGQKCRKCKDTFVLPYALRPLNKPDGLDKSDPKKRHPSELCQLCLAGFCRKKSNT